MANKHHEDFWVTVATQRTEAMTPNVAHMIGAAKFIERLEPNERLDYVKQHAIVWKMETEEFRHDDLGDRMNIAGVVLTICALLPQSRAVEFRMRFDS